MGKRAIHPQLSLVVLGILLATVISNAQAPNRWRGTVSNVTADSLSLKTDSGETVNVLFASKLRVQKVSPEDRDLSKAQEIAVADILAGDRILIRGTQEGDKVTALSMIVMTARDIAKKNTQEQQAWRERGTLGMVEQVNVPAGEVQIRARTPEGPAPLLVAVDAKTHVRGYPPDSVHYADTVPSRIGEIHAGDQLRALGVKDATGKRLTAEKLVFGEFRTLAGTVAQANPEIKQVQLKDLQTGEMVLIHIKADTQMKKMFSVPQGTAEGPPGGSGRPAAEGGSNPTPGASRSMAPAGPPGGGSGSWPGAGGGPAGRMGGVPDLSRMIDHMPATTLAELKTDEVVLLSCVPGSKPNEYTAIVLLTGVEPLLMRLAARAGNNERGSMQSLTGSWPASMTGAMDGMLGMPSIP